MRRHPVVTRTSLLIAVTFAAVFDAGCGTGRPAPAPVAADKPLPLVVDGFASPESVIHDAIADVYLVSNIDGSPFEADGRGFVSRVAPDGRVLSARWIDGLDAPKGIAVSSTGDLLAVADLTVLRLFDRASGSPRAVVKVPGATFLNDVAAAPDGSFYVSDSGMAPAPAGLKPTGSDGIFRVTADGAVTPLARGPELAMPNGIAVLDDALVVLVSFGDARVRGFGPDGRPQAGAAVLPAGQADGVVALDDGCLAISSFEAPGLFAGPRSGPFTLVAKGMHVADLGVDRRRGRLLLPLIAEGKLRVTSIDAIVAGCRRAAEARGD